jgi:hypothetical protein
MNEFQKKEMVYVDLSAGQYTPFGGILHSFYYGGKYYILRDMLHFSTTSSDKSGYSGYPHNGGEHSLRLSLPREEMIAYLEMAAEHAELSMHNHFVCIVKEIVANLNTNRFYAKKIWEANGDINKAPPAAY